MPTVLAQARRHVTAAWLLVAAAAVAALGVVRSTAEPDSAETTVERHAAAVRSAARAWLLEGYGPECPTLARLVRDGFLSPAETRLDRWGTAFAIDCAGGQVHVRSAGPDRQFGTADDSSALRE